MASSFKVTACLSPSLLLSFCHANSLLAVESRHCHGRREGIYFSHFTMSCQHARDARFESQAHCLQQSLKTPSNESLCTLHFNLIIIVSFSYQGNYSTGTSNSGFLSKYRVQCTYWLQTPALAEVMSDAWSLGWCKMSWSRSGYILIDWYPLQISCYSTSIVLLCSRWSSVKNAPLHSIKSYSHCCNRAFLH